MSIEATKLELVKTILSINNLDILSRVSEFLKQEKSDFWDDLSIEQKREIEQGITELNNGKRISLESFMKKMNT